MSTITNRPKLILHFKRQETGQSSRPEQEEVDLTHTSKSLNNLQVSPSPRSRPSKKPILLHLVIHGSRGLIGGSRTPLSDKGLRAFPVEVCEMIFKYALRSAWNGKTPGLIKALRRSRTHHALYLEALRAFNLTNCFILNRGNGWSFEDMEEKSIKTIKAFGIEIGNPNLRYHWEKLLWPFQNTTILKSLKFHTLQLTDMAGPSPTFGEAEKYYRNLQISRLLTSTILPWHRQEIKTVLLRTHLEQAFYIDLLEMLNKIFRRPAKLLRVSIKDDLVWLWDLKAQEEKDWTLPTDMNFWGYEVSDWHYI